MVLMHFNVHIHSFNSKWNRPECRMKLNIAESRQIQRRYTELTTSSQAKSQFSVDHYCKCNRHRIQIAASNKTSFIQMLCVVAGLHLSHGWFFVLFSRLFLFLAQSHAVIQFQFFLFCALIYIDYDYTSGSCYFAYSLIRI